MTRGMKMRVKSLRLANYRGIDELTLGFGEVGPVVLVGENGAGKSSVLDAVAIMLSQLMSRIENKTGRRFDDNDIKNGKSKLEVDLELSYDGYNYKWSAQRTRKEEKRIMLEKLWSLEQVKRLAKGIKEELEFDRQADIPLAIYYPIHRAVIDIPLRIRTKHTFDQVASFDQALSGGRNDFRIFFEWFREREDLENEIRLDSDRNYFDRELKAVRLAITSFLPGFSRLRIRRSPLRMVVDKGGIELRIDQLSDGEKCMLALVGDLARRLAIANPSRKDSLSGKAIVLIDEIELHLHPEWQRMIIPTLLKTFPQTQFIITTHSPQILSEIKPNDIFLLKRTEKKIEYIRPKSSYGRDSNSILEEILGVSDRPMIIKQKLESYFEAIAVNDLAKMKDLRQELEHMMGGDEEPAFAKADILLRRKELIGR